MWQLYNWIVIPILKAAFSFLGLFNPKVQKGIKGRADVLDRSRSHYSLIPKTRRRVLVHVASFGELEQAKPVMQALRDQYPDLHIHLTFFSPSGYDNTIGKYTIPDIITYLPFDDLKTVQEFIALVEPALALITRYDVWPNFIKALKEKGAGILLFCATFGESSKRNALFSKGFNREVYSLIDRIVTISEKDRQAFLKLGLLQQNVITAGDTRFDQVLLRKENKNIPKEVALLKDQLLNKEVFVAGSTWPKDEEVLEQGIATFLAHPNRVAVIAPHEVSDEHLKQLKERFSKYSIIILSSIDKYHDEQIILVDSIGKLFSLYALADIAYVGGGFSAGVHNVLEASVWNVPVIVGPHHRRSSEITALINKRGAFEITDAKKFDATLHRLITNNEERRHAGKVGEAYVVENSGATNRLLAEAASLLH